LIIYYISLNLLICTLHTGHKLGEPYLTTASLQQSSRV